MRTTRAGRAFALLALAILSAACETGTGPGGADAFQATLDDYEALDKALASKAWEGFQALGGRTPFSRSAAAIEAVGAIGEPAFASRLADRLAGAAEGRASGPARAPIISGTHRGKTLVYDPAKDQYVIASDRTGAPATGVRFVLYEVDAAGKPVVGKEIGHADLIDEGDASAQDVALHLKVVAHGATVIDYRTTVDEQPGGGALTVRGFLQGDGVQLDFDIEVAARRTTDGALLDGAFELAIDARDFSVTGELRGVREGAEGEGEVDVTARHGDHSVRVDVDGENGIIDGTVYVNGDVFATLSGRASSPTVLNRSGQPVTGVELLVLHRIVDGIEDVFDLLEDLVDPVDDLVLLGIIL